MLLGTHLLFKDSQQKQMDDHLVWFAATVAESKLSIDCMCLLISFHELICTGKQNERSLLCKSFVFVTYKYEWSIVDNEIYLRNENEIPLGISIFWHNQQAALRVFIRNTFLAVRYNIWRSINCTLILAQLKLVRGFKSIWVFVLKKRAKARNVGFFIPYGRKKRLIDSLKRQT